MGKILQRLLLAPCLYWLRAEAFGVAPPALRAGASWTPVASASTVKLYSMTEGVSIGQRFYQLEEMEDKETEITEVFLNADGTVTLGETDGPVFTSGSGSWTQSRSGGDTPPFRMTLVRTFDAGKDKRKYTDMGTFTFTVERVYTGEFSLVGSKTALSGVIHQIDDGVDREVGYFNMLDTTNERLGEKDS